MIRITVALALLALPFGAALAQRDEGPPRWAASIARKQQVIMYGLTPAYADLSDSSPYSEAKLRRGRTLFDSHCTGCHGWTGQGSGPQAFASVPAPADLEWLARAPKKSSEPYIYWSIADGGRQFESDMPAFKDRLSKRDIWALVTYIRAGLPRSSP